MGDTGRFGSYLLAILSVCMTLSHTGVAAAQASRGETRTAPATTRFTRAGAWMVELEGLLDLQYVHGGNDTTWVDDDGNAVHTKNTSSSLWFAAFSPRVALDAFVIDHLSVGLTAGFHESNSTSETSNNGQSYWSSQTDHSLNLTPRVGFAFMSESGAGLWIRGGVGISSHWWENAPVPKGAPSGSSAEYFDLQFEALGAFMVRRDLVVYLGPSLKKGVGSSGDGSASPEENPPVYGVALGAGLVL
jgi:hypothetical protein